MVMLNSKPAAGHVVISPSTHNFKTTARDKRKHITTAVYRS